MAFPSGPLPSSTTRRALVITRDFVQQICTCVVTACILLAWLLCVMGPVLLYRTLLKGAAKIFRSDFSRMLHEQGAMFLKNSVNTEPEQNMAIALRVEGTLTFDTIKSIILKRLVGRYPELRQHCVKWGGYFFWAPIENFNIDHYVTRRRLKPGDEPAQAQIEFVREPIGGGRSPWAAVVMEPAESASCLTVVFKMHHLLVDGTTLVRAAFTFADDDSPPKYNRNVGKTVHPLGNGIWDAITYVPRALLELSRLVNRRCAPMPWSLSKPKSAHSKYRMSTLCPQRISMVKIKEIARQHSVTVNAVVQAALTGALRSFVLARYPKSILPDELSFSQAVPVRHHPKGLCNSNRTVTYTLPIGMEDLAEHLVACDRMLEERKQSLEGHVTFYVFEMLGRLPPFLGIFGLIMKLLPEFVFTTTNLPGPMNTVYLDGAKVIGCQAYAMAASMNLHIFMVTYDGWMEYSVNGNSRIFSQEDVEDLGRRFAEEFELLSNI